MSARLRAASTGPAAPADTAPLVAPPRGARRPRPRGQRAALAAAALPGGIRTRILAWYVVLLMLSIAFTVIGLRQILLTQLASDIDKALAQEVEEVRRLAGGVDPATGMPFGDNAAAIFDTFFVRSVPGEYEALYALVDGEPYKRTVAPISLFEDPAALAAWQAAYGTNMGTHGNRRRPGALAGRPARGRRPPGGRLRRGLLRGRAPRPDRPDGPGDAGGVGGRHPARLRPRVGGGRPRDRPAPDA